MRYFFDVYCAAESTADPEGMEIRTGGEVRQEAARILAHMALDHLEEQSTPLELHVVVRAENRSIVHKARLRIEQEESE